MPKNAPVSEARATKRRLMEFDRARKIATRTAQALQPREGGQEALRHARWLAGLHRSKYPPHDGARQGGRRVVKAWVA